MNVKKGSIGRTDLTKWSKGRWHAITSIAKIIAINAIISKDETLRIQKLTAISPNTFVRGSSL
jgi:hypothetical protein